MISIIIPAYNEANGIARLIHYLKDNSEPGAIEIIVSDGGSTDDTLAISREAGAQALSSPQKGRGAQMNFGASHARGGVLYFVHADTFPPRTFVNDIRQALAGGYAMGRYRTRFDSTKTILKLNAFFTRFDFFMCYGGDQTLFMERELFDAIGGFKTGMLIMEEYEIVQRARQKARYKIMQKDALVSARKYDSNSWLTVQKANYTIVKMYKQGATQEAMVAQYKKMLDYR